MNRKIQSISASDYTIEDIHNIFASECTISHRKRGNSPRRRCKSEPDTGYSVNYDDLCGPWSFGENPFHAKQDDSIKPRLCVWKLLTPEGIASIKRSLDDEVAIKHLIEKLLGNKTPFANDTCRKLFAELACSIIRFSKDNEFTEEGTSALVGIFHLTLTYFLSNPWRTVEETYKFFRATALLHAVENPPKSIEIFTSDQCAKAVDFFLTILVKHLPLVRFVCVPNWVCILNLPKPN